MGGSPVASVDIYVSADGGAYQLAFSNVGSGGAVYTGLPNHTYSFYSIAADTDGRTEAAPSAADASVTLSAEQIVLGGTVTRAARTDQDGTPLTITYTGPGTATIVRWSEPGTGRGDLYSVSVFGGTTASRLTLATTGIGAAGACPPPPMSGAPGIPAWGLPPACWAKGVGVLSR